MNIVETISFMLKPEAIYRNKENNGIIVVTNGKDEISENQVNELYDKIEEEISLMILTSEELVHIDKNIIGDRLL